MENASKALIMAGSMLLGIIVISLAVYIFSMFGNYTSETYDKMEATQIDQFNAKFLKYYGTIGRYYKDDDGVEHTVNETITCTIHDIVSLANLAYENNVKYEMTEENEHSENTYYVQIDIKNEKKHIEKLGNNKEEQIKLIQNNSTKTVTITGEDGNQKDVQEVKYYKCIKADISKITKRVNYMVFDKYP